MDTTQIVTKGVEAIPGLKLLGSCEAMIVCFAGDTIPVVEGTHVGTPMLHFFVFVLSPSYSLLSTRLCFPCLAQVLLFSIISLPLNFLLLSSPDSFFLSSAISHVTQC